METIASEVTEDFFRKKVEGLIHSSPTLNIDDALEVTLDFFKNFKISGVDTTVTDNDMLLFQYGTYDWHDGKGENFTVNLTRQFYVENNDSEEFYQLGLTLYYESKNFIDIKSFNKWSIEFSKIDDWEKSIKDTPAFKKARKINATTFDISFSLT